MAIATTGCGPVRRLVDALGLQHVRSMHISAELNSAVAIVTEQYVTESQLDRLAGELETKEWVLVPKAEWIDAQLSISRASGTTSTRDGRPDRT